MLEIIKGQIIYTKTLGKFETYPNGYLIIEDGKVKEVTLSLPSEYADKEVKDMGNCLVIPGFVDVHLHAPQWPNAGVGYSKELIDWLNQYTFPLESQYSDLAFAEKHYRKFVNDLWEVGTTRACIMATKHLEATRLLIELFREAGLGAYIGKVNMDRNAMDELREETDESIEATKALIEEYADVSGVVKYIVTPRFVPSTTSKLMLALGELAKQHDLPVQSHLDENRGEIEWVKELHPESKSYTHVYKDHGLIRKGQTIMAHCIYNTDEEIQELKESDVMVAHCAQSNFNLSSGIMPLRKYLNLGIRVGLGSDVGAGHTLDMRQHIVDTIHASKMYWVNHPEDKALSFAEGFYLATKGGGSFFGKVGSFEKGYEADLLVIDDGVETDCTDESLVDRLEKYVYGRGQSKILKRYVAGNEIVKF